MIKYKRMNLDERENIFYLVHQNYPQNYIAKTLGRNKSSISREPCSLQVRSSRLFTR
ncbi:MAG: helix-turn-helix domain-containing protein [Rickettsiaceae bacterium]|nr:helix-turn-helix domain-containing protein [Rickettsiaceae bacterium]